MLEKVWHSLIDGIVLSIVLLLLLGLTAFQPEAYASNLAPEQALSKIDSVRFGHIYPAQAYEPVLNTLSSRCSSDTGHIADMSAVVTNQLFKNGRKFDNLSFLQQALDATVNGTAGISCEEIFAMLQLLIEGGA